MRWERWCCLVIVIVVAQLAACALRPLDVDGEDSREARVIRPTLLSGAVESPGELSRTDDELERMGYWQKRPDLGMLLWTPENWTHKMVELQPGLKGPRFSVNGGRDGAEAFVTICSVPVDSGLGINGDAGDEVIYEGATTIHGVPVRFREIFDTTSVAEMSVYTTVVSYTLKDRVVLAIAVLSEEHYQKNLPMVTTFLHALRPLEPVVQPPKPEAPPQWPSLAQAPSSRSSVSARDAALIVGVEDYLLAPDVEGAVQNAADWVTYLTEGRGMPLANLRLLRNQEATREEILDAMAQVSRRVSPGGTLWIVFIGHGAPALDGQDGVLVGVDAQQTPRSLKARSVPQKELFAVAAQGRQGRTIAVLDTCFSGKTADGDSLAPGMQPFVPVRAADSQFGVIVLTAARGDQAAGPLPGEPRPAFSYLVLGGLRGWADLNNDGSVQADEVLRYTQNTLSVMARDRMQTPELVGDGRVVLSDGAQEAGPNVRDLLLR